VYSRLIEGTLALTAGAAEDQALHHAQDAGKLREEDVGIQIGAAPRERTQAGGGCYEHG